MVACQYQDVGPLVPNRYGALRDLKLPANQTSAPVSVPVIASTVTVPAQTNAVYSGIATLGATSQTPAALVKVVSDLNSVLSNMGVTANELVAGFTPQVVATLTSVGTLPNPVQAIVSAVNSNQTMRPYAATYTFPKVAGQDIGTATTTIKLPDLIGSFVTPISASLVISEAQVKPYAYVGNDATFNEAVNVFMTTVKSLETSRLDQLSLVNAVYTSTQKTADTDLANCQSSNPSKYNSLVANTLQSLNGNIGFLNVNKSRLGDAAYTTLMAFLYTQYTAQIQIYYQLQAADTNACKITADAKNRYITIYRDTNLNTINDTFNKTILQAQAFLKDIHDESPQNQGSGQ
jgi:hypothetical protein